MSTRYPFPLKSLDDAAEGPFRLHDERGPGSRFHFRLPLPAGFRRRGDVGPAPTRRSPSSLLARYAPADEPGAEISVTGRLLGRDVAPADVLQIELERSKEKVLERRLIDSPDGSSIDVLSTRRTVPNRGEPVPPGFPPSPPPRSLEPEVESCSSSERGVLVLRRSAVKLGNRMLIIDAAATAETYERWAERLAVVTTGLRFLQPGTWHCAEALSTFSRKSPSDFLLFYPESWRLEEPAAVQPGLLSARLVSTAGDRVAGRMDLAVVARAAQPGLRALVDGYLGSLRSAGFEAPPARLSRIPPPAAYQKAWEGTGEAASRDARLEVRLHLGQRPEAWFCFALLGPTRRSAPDVWAVNRRALELAFGLVATPDVPAEGWLSEAIERSRRPSGAATVPPG